MLRKLTIAVVYKELQVLRGFQAFKVINKDIQNDEKLEQFEVSGGFEAFVYSWFKILYVVSLKDLQTRPIVTRINVFYIPVNGIEKIT